MPAKRLTVSETTPITLVETSRHRTCIAVQNHTETLAAMAGDAVIYISDDPECSATKGYGIPPKGYFIIEKGEGLDPRKKWYIISDTATTYVTVLEQFLKVTPEEEELKEDIQDKYPHDPPM